jgi:N-acetyltransferase
MFHIQPITLTGPLIRLESLTTGHIAALHRVANHDRSTFGLTSVPTTLESTTKYVETALKLMENNQALPFATVLQATGEVIGSTRFANLEFWQWQEGFVANNRSNPDAAEIGWTWLAPKAQRTGINREAKRLMLAYAFDVWQVRRVTLRTDARNQRSRQAIEGIGGKLDGILRCHLPASDGGTRDSAVYSILANEYRQLLAKNPQDDAKASADTSL